MNWDRVLEIWACGWMLPQSGREEKGDKVIPLVHKKHEVMNIASMHCSSPHSSRKAERQNFLIFLSDQ